MRKVFVALAAALFALPVLADVTGLVSPPGGSGGSSLPSQTGNSGKYLTTDGTSASWASPTASASSITPGTTTVSGATAPCLIDNSTGTTMGCAAIGNGLTLSSSTISATQALNAQTGTTYTIASTDAGKLVTFSNASAIAVTLPVATTTGFGAGFAFTVQNLGVGLVTITPTTSTINGAASLTIPTNMGCAIVSDGTNYQVGACGALQAQVSAQSAGISVTPSCAYKVNTVTSTAYTISAPTASAATTATTGGTSLAASTTYYVVVTATTASGETVLGTVESVTTGTGTTNTVTANWTDVTGATGYNVYISTSTITAGEASVAYQTALSTATSSTFTAVPGTTQTTPSANTSGQFTVNAPTGCTPYDGQELILFVQSASGGTLTYSASSYLTGATTGAWPSASNAASKDDHFVLIYDGYLGTPGWTLDGYNLGL